MRGLSLQWDASLVGRHRDPVLVEKEKRYEYEPSLFNRSWIASCRHGARNFSDPYCRGQTEAVKRAPTCER
jgi:hypothetical protein